MSKVLKDKYYFRAAAYQRVLRADNSEQNSENSSFTDSDIQQIETKAQEPRDERARRIRVRDGHEE